MGFGPAKIDHADAVTYRRAAEAFRRGDLTTLAETIHDDVAWHLPGTSWVSREIRGRQALLERWFHFVTPAAFDAFFSKFA
jgi:ketosteroid isomerase-like protein